MPLAEGALTDNAFSAIYAAGQNILGMNQFPAAWVLANKPYWKTSYQPPQWRSNGPAITVLPGPGNGVYGTSASDDINRSNVAPFLLQIAGGYEHLTNYGASAAVCNFALD